MELHGTLLIVYMCSVVQSFSPGPGPLTVFGSGRNGVLDAMPLAAESTPSSPLSSRNDGDSTELAKGVTLKIAFDSRGGVADLSSEKSERFTCGESLDMVHRLRRVSDAVLVGRSTVEIDDCTLTVRRVPLLSSEKQPTRVIVDPRLDLDLGQYKIFQDGLATIVVHIATVDDVKMKTEKDTGAVKFVKSTNKGYPNVVFLGLPPIVDQDEKRLSARQIYDVLSKEFDLHHIMVEGGPNTALQFVDDGVVDRVILVHAPIEFKDPLLSNISTTTLDRAGLKPIGSYTLGVDSVECFSRSNVQWPSTDVSSWP